MSAIDPTPERREDLERRIADARRIADDLSAAMGCAASPLDEALFADGADTADGPDATDTAPPAPPSIPPAGGASAPRTTVKRGRAAPAAAEPDTDTDDTDGTDGDPRPMIILRPELADVADECVAALAGCPDLYQQHPRGLVRVLTAPAPKGDKRAPAEGMPVLEAVDPVLVRGYLSRVARFGSYVDTKRGPKVAVATVPLSTAQHVVAMRSYPAESIRVLRGLTTAPVLRPDGSVVTAPGYDRRTGLLLLWIGEPVEVPDAPTREDARAAYMVLCKPFRDFRFRDTDERRQGIARAGLVAAVLTPLARHAIAGPVPGFMCEADDPGAGKSLAMQVCGAIVLGRPPGARQYTGDDDEMSKRIASVGLSGAPLWMLDNVREHIAGGALESALTAYPTIAARMLGTNSDVEIPWNAVTFMTANGASYSRDMVDRMVHIGLRKRTADETPAGELPPVLSLVLAERRELLAAALTILRAHAVAGRPQGATLPRFEAWSRVVSSAVCWASGGDDPALARPPASANRDALVARAAVLAIATAYRGNPVTCAAMRADCADPRDPALVELRQALADLAGVADLARASGVSLGRKLAALIGRAMSTTDGTTVTLVDAGESGGVRRFRTVSA